MVDPTRRGDLLLSISDLDDNYDGNPLATRYQNFAANGHLEFRPNTDTSAFLSAGYAKGGALFFNSQGAGYQDGQDYWVQGRVQAGGLFALLSTTTKTVVAPVTQHSYTTLDSAKLLKMLRLKHKFSTTSIYLVS